MNEKTRLGIQLRNEIKKTAPHIYGGGFVNMRLIEKLVKDGADIECLHDAAGKMDDKTPLLLAVSGNDPDIARLLLEAGANTEAADFFGTPIVSAAQKGALDIIRLLLEHNADINARCWTGHTALMHAAINGHGDVADYLLSKGADPRLEDKNNVTAAALAALYGHEEIAERIQKYIAVYERRQQKLAVSVITESFGRGQQAPLKRSKLTRKPPKPS